MAYTIQINEEQRAIIAALLTQHCPGDAFPAAAPINEAALLRDMFNDLPAQETEAPASIHGFCL